MEKEKKLNGLEIDLKSGQKAAFKRLFNDFKEEINSELLSVKSTIESIKNFNQKYLEGDEDNESLKVKLEELHENVNESVLNIKEKEEAIQEVYELLIEGTSTTDSISTIFDELVSDTSKKAEEIEKRRRELEAFYEKVYGKELNGKIATVGYKQQFENKIKATEDFLQDQESKYGALFEQIKSLLPGATSIGLAKAFEDQKKSYSIHIYIWSVIFVVSMIGMALFGIYYILEISKTNNLDVTQALVSIINKLPFFVPTIWLAVFASKQQSQYKRLQQEYAFKETFAKSYDGQKTQLERLNVSPTEMKDTLKRLLEHLVRITSHNPSDTLESDKHNESPLFQPFNLLAKTLKPNTNENKTV